MHREIIRFRFEGNSQQRQPMNFTKDLDTPLLQLTPTDTFTLRDACAGGLHIFGSPGAGKTSGPGRMAAGSLLRTNAGGLVTISKPDDVELWRTYASEHGRADSLIVFDEREGFNFLDYLLAVHGMDGIGTVVETLMRVIESARNATGSAGSKGDDIWQDSSRKVLRYTLPPLYAATGSLSISHIIRFIIEAPKKLEEPFSPEWQQRSFMHQVMQAAATCPKIPMSKAALDDCVEYWTKDFCGMTDRLLSSVVVTVTTALDRFKHGRLNKLFCGKTTVVPEMTFHGAVIVLAMPTLTWHEDGVIAQQLFRFLWQRAVIGRNRLAAKHRERPVFLWSDEAQELVDRDTANFISASRSSLCSVVHLTQSIPSYYAKMSGANPRDAATSLVGKFTNHVYASNACPETNEYASRMIGKVLKRRYNYSRGTSHNTSRGFTTGRSESFGTSHTSGSSSSSSSQGGTTSGYSSSSSFSSTSGRSWSENYGTSDGESENNGYSESMEYVIEPGEFGRCLQVGGPANNYEVTAVWFKAGHVFEASGTNMLVGKFRQK
jgi:hypothetical protein